MLKTNIATDSKITTCNVPNVPNVIAYPVTTSPSVTGLANTLSSVPFALSPTKVMRVRMVVSKYTTKARIPGTKKSTNSASSP